MEHSRLAAQCPVMGQETGLESSKGLPGKLRKTAAHGCSLVSAHEVLISGDPWKFVCATCLVLERGVSFHPTTHSLRLCFCRQVLANRGNLIIVNLFQAIFAVFLFLFSRLLPCVSVPSKHCLSFADIFIVFYCFDCFHIPSLPQVHFFFTSSPPPPIFLQFLPLLIAESISSRRCLPCIISFFPL